MSVRRLTTLTLLFFLNLIVGIVYLQPSRIMTLIANPLNDTGLFDNSNNRSSLLPNKTNRSSLLSNKTSGANESREVIFTLNPRDLCPRGKLALLILVCTAVPNVRQRQAVRETWGSYNSSVVRLAFVVGAAANDALQRQTADEFRRHGDIIQQRGFLDSYRNLTLKSIALLRWAADHCPRARFLLKTDDDMFVNVANLLKVLARAPVKTNVMYGVLFRRARPNRNPTAKWFVPKSEFGGSVFPDYLSGTAYVMSGDVAPRLLEASGDLPFLVMEDVFVTGLCAAEARVRRLHVRGFAHWRRSPTGCAFKDTITGHHVTPPEMKKIWRELQSKPLLCSRRRVI